MNLLIKDGFKAVLLGHRYSDPAAPEEFVLESSAGWPAFSRVFPILNWTYFDVWQFLRLSQSEVCKLYEQGYSSLGPMSLTKPNPLLGGKPAWELLEIDSERNGRLGG